MNQKNNIFLKEKLQGAVKIKALSKLFQETKRTFNQIIKILLPNDLHSTLCQLQ